VVEDRDVHVIIIGSKSKHCFSYNETLPFYYARVHVEFARGPSRGRGRFRPYGGSSRGGGGGGGYYSSSRGERPSGGLTYAEK